jgi:hypothetical protein
MLQWKAISIMYSECVFVALLSSLQSPCAVLCCHLRPVRLNLVLPHYLTNSSIFGEKSLSIKWVFWFSLQLLSATFVIVRRTEQDMTINVTSLHVKCPIILLMFCWPCIIVYQYSETNVMHCLFNLLRIKGLYMFRALLSHPQEAPHKRHLVLRMCYVSWLHQDWSETQIQLINWIKSASRWFHFPR